MNEKILLADDAESTRSIQRTYLEKEGYVVCEAKDGIEAVEKFKELKPDVTVLDIGMPNMDGLKALRQIKTENPYANVIIISALSQEDNVVTALKWGVRDFLAKPFNPEQFLKIVKAVLAAEVTKMLPESIANDWCIEHRDYKPDEKLSQEQIDRILEDFNRFYALASTGNYSTTDKLTGCPKGGAFNVTFARMLADETKKYSNITIVMLDIDEFMRVNTDFGHKTGDEVLKEIAKILLDIDAGHQTYRYSGDCFMLLFPNYEKEQVFLIIEEARKKIAEAPECSRTSATISAGIATYPDDGDRDVEIIRKADGAMYRAKVAGRNRIALAKEEKLVTKTAHYTVEQLKRLEKLSDGTGISEAALMREALDELLKKYDK
ncbi:MAG: diguanylate cyclase [Oscillospiraceae bacterium]|nr:diguanylate cyclase [Oscillospiraceae bacterium]